MRLDGISQCSLADVNLGIKMATDTATVIASQRFLNKYAVLWNHVPKSDVETLRKQVEDISSNLSGPAKQNLEEGRELECLYEQAHQALPEFQKECENISVACGAEFVLGTIKDIARVIEKLENDYTDPMDIATESALQSLQTAHTSLKTLKFVIEGKNAVQQERKLEELENLISKMEVIQRNSANILVKNAAKRNIFSAAENVLDILRASFICGNLKSVIHLLETLSGSKQMRIVKVKNGFKDDLQKGGYKDLKLYVQVSGHIAEIQIHMNAYFKVKDKAHKIYESMRSLPVPGSYNVDDQLAGKTPGASTVMKNILSLRFHNLSVMKENFTDDDFTLSQLSNCFHGPASWDTAESTEAALREKIAIESKADISECMILRANWHINDRHFEDARGILNNVLDFLPKADGNWNTMFPHLEAKVWRAKAHVSEMEGRYDDALEIGEKEERIVEKVFGPESLQYAEIFHIKGRIFRLKGKYDESLDCHQDALKIQLRVFSKDAENDSLSNAYEQIGKVLESNGDYDGAMKQYRKALEIKIKTLGEKHPAVAAAHHNIGDVLYRKGDISGFQRENEKALEIEIMTLGENHLDVASDYHNIGSVLDTKGDYGGAMKEYKKALATRMKTLGESHPSMAAYYHKMGRVLDPTKNFEGVMNEFKTELENKIKTFGQDHPVVAGIYNIIGVGLHCKGDYDGAIMEYKNALGIFSKTLGEDHRIVADTHNNIGNGLRDKGDHDGAIEEYRKALEIRIKTLGEKHPDVAAVYDNIGNGLREKGEYDEARKQYEKVWEIRIEILGENHPETKRVLENMKNLNKLQIRSKKPRKKLLGFF